MKAAPGAGCGLLLAPGASAGRDQPALVAIERALTPHGVAVERMDFPYRLAGRRSPDRPPVLVAAVRRAAAGLAADAGLPPDRILLGGRSLGGRMCSLAAAGAAEGGDGNGKLPCLGLVLVSYPLHPPGKPDRPRSAHFPDLDVPCLFVSGSRDAFASPEELEDATAAIPGPVTVVVLDGGDHGLRGKDAVVAGVVQEWVLELATNLGPPHQRAGRPRG